MTRFALLFVALILGTVVVASWSVGVGLAMLCEAALGFWP